MFLQYAGKRSERDIISDIIPQNFTINSDDWWILLHGDNLRIMKWLLNAGYAGKVQLVYIDPPFATNMDFRIDSNWRTNTISMDKSASIAYSDTRVWEEFIEFLRERLILIRELLSEKGSIYLHIDYKIGHYVKVIMDEVFGIQNFRNDITRIKCNPKNFQRKAYGNVKDMILFYSKWKDPIWNNSVEEMTNDEKTRLFKKQDGIWRLYTTIPLHAPWATKDGETWKAWRGVLPPIWRHWRSAPSVLEKLDQDGLIEWSKNGVPRKKIYLDEKKWKKRQDIWEFKDSQYPDYPTEKNIDLIKTIIQASSNPWDLVLDAFCWSGTTLVGAKMLERKWIGIDESKYAIEVCKKRLIQDIKIYREDHRKKSGK